MQPSRELRLAILAILSAPLTAPITPARADEAGGPVSNSTVAIGGDKFSVDPRQGVLNYSYTFFDGNVNYGQTPFSLALQYQQTAAGTYVGNFTDSHSHAHPYGASAYLPTPLPGTNEPNSSNDDDAGGVWDLNLPALFINTAYASSFYGQAKNNNGDHPYVIASLSLGDSTYQYLTPMALYSTDSVTPVPWDTWTNSFVANGRPLYSKDTTYLNVQTFNLSALNGYTPPDQQRLGISVQDKQGATYYFAPAVLYGWEGPNVYKPSYSPNNNSTTPKMDELFVYRIARIVYPTGQFLNFTYADDFKGNTSHTVSISGTDSKTIAEVSYNQSSGTVKIADAADALQSLYQINFTGADYRVKSVVNLSNSRSIAYSYFTNQSVPYSWNNQTALSAITNAYTGASTAIKYAQFNKEVYDAGCNEFYLGQVAVQSLTNTSSGAQVSQATYDFGFGNSSQSNFIVPVVSGDKTYGSGLDHWLDGIYYDTNQDSSGCSASDTVNPAKANLTYGATITTTYSDANRNRVQTLSYDAYGRTISETIKGGSGAWSEGSTLTSTAYTYELTPDLLLALGDYAKLPMAFASPTSTASGMNFCTLNGTVLQNGPNCMIAPTQSWVYDDAGNPTQETSRLGQLTEYAYLPASMTNPPNERLAVTSKLHSIGLNGQSYVLQTQQFQNFAIAPGDALPGSLTQATLPVSNAETRFDANTGATYAYRTDTMGGYVAGNTSEPVLNGILTQRTQQDDTGVSDVASVTTQYTPSMTSTAGGQTVLAMTSTLSGGGASRNRGGTQVSSMGYPIQTTDGLGRATTRSYDAYGRTLSETYLAGTPQQQTTTTAYDSDLGQTPQPIAGQTVLPTAYSVRTTDPFGNVVIKTYDNRQRQTGAFEQRVGSALVQTEGYGYMGGSDDRLTAMVRYGNGWQKQENYYYARGSSQRVATVPNVGLAEGTVVDGINGNTLTFKYAPGALPLTIGAIYGPARIVHANRISHLVLSEGLIDAAAATTALKGLNLDSFANGLVNLGNNPWTGFQNQAPSELQNLYQAIGSLPGGSGNASNLLEYTTYGYDEWNRKVSITHYALYNGAANGNSPTLSETTSSLTYNMAKRAITTTYPQGQQETRSYNLLNGLQEASLLVNGVTTPLGNIFHDGLGRVSQYNDLLNGGQATASYAPGTGLLSAATDVYGNARALSYDPTTGLLTQTSLTPAGGGSPITVNYSYDNHLQPTQTTDSQGATYTRGYGADGSLGSTTTQFAGQNANGQGFFYDAYGDLAGVTDSYLPPVLPGGICAQDIQAPSYYQISRDSYGRLSSLNLIPYQGNWGNNYIYRSLGYDPVTGLVNAEATGNLPPQLSCDTPTSDALALTTALGYDQNLRPAVKTVTRSDLAGKVPPLPTGVADLSLTVTAPVKARRYKELSYTLTVRNKTPRLGGSPAMGVTLNFLPAGTAAEHLVYTRIPKGCALGGGKVTCALPDLAGGKRARITLAVKPTAEGVLKPRIRVHSAALDPVRNNHTLTAATRVCVTATCPGGGGVRYLADRGVGSGQAGQAVFGLTYDTANHVVQSARQDITGNSLTESYGYDLQTGALVSYVNDAGVAMPYARWPNSVPIDAATFQYDLYGNLTRKTYTSSVWGLSAQVAIAAGAGGNPFQASAVAETGVLIQQTGNVGVQGAYQYDIAGNVTSDPYGRHYAYDAHGLLASITRADGGQETYVCDGRGRLMQRQATWLGAPVFEYGHARHAGSQWQVEFTGGVTYFPDGPFQGNTQPNTLAVTDLQGRAVNTLSYGNNSSLFTVLANTGFLPDGIATNLLAPTAGYPAGIADTSHYPTGAMGTALGVDVGTGLQMKGGYRAYDPVVGRFMQWDSLSPFGRGGLHGYAYAGNDPVNFDDPTGHYAEAKTHRYGPKPPHAHHYGFWQGFLAGMKAGAESIYMQPYHFGKSMVHDFATGNLAGLGKMAFNAAFSSIVDAYTGGAGQMVFSEFVSTNGSAIFSGKSPFKGHVPFKGNAYQIGYQLGDQSAAGAELAALTLITLGAGAAVDAVAVDVEALSVDVDVAADTAQTSSDAMLSAKNMEASAERIAEASGDWETVFDANEFDANEPAAETKPNTLKYSEARSLRGRVRQASGKRWWQSFDEAEKGGINDYFNKLSDDNFEEIGVEFRAGARNLDGRTNLDFASAMDSTPKSVYVLRSGEIASHLGMELSKADLADQQDKQAPNPNAMPAGAAGPSKPVPYQ